MTDKPGDGLDVDAAWAEIVAHWDVEDLRVVTDDEPDHDGEDAGAATTAVAGSDPDTGTGTGTGDPTGWTRIDLDGGSGAGDGVLPVPPHAPGRPRPVGRPPRHADDTEDTSGASDVPGLGWDAIRPHVGRADFRSAARGPERRRAGDEPQVPRDRADDDDPAMAALDEHFVPADPPSLHPSDPLSALAWLGALGGPLFLLVAALVWRDAPSWLIGVAVLAFVAGFVTLVVRMPDEREDTDDGAVV